MEDFKTFDADFDELPSGMDFEQYNEETIKQKTYEKVLGIMAFSLEHWYPGVFTRKRFDYYTNTMYLEWKIPMTTEVLSMVDENAPYIYNKLTVKEGHTYIYWYDLMEILHYLYAGPRLNNDKYLTDFYESEKYQALKEVADTINHVRKSMIYSKLNVSWPEDISEIICESLKSLILPW